MLLTITHVALFTVRPPEPSSWLHESIGVDLLVTELWTVDTYEIDRDVKPAAMKRKY